MPTFRVRELGSIGIVSDIAAWDLPPNAFSDGMNVRFSPELGISRAPSFRTALDFSAVRGPDAIPVAVSGLPTNSATTDRLFVVDQGGSVYDWSSSETPVEMVMEGFTPLASPGSPVLSRMYGNLLVHLPGGVPSYIRPDDSLVRHALAGWPSDLRAKSLKSFGDQIFAFNLTQGAALRPRSCRHSGFGNGEMPTSWDINDAETGAGEIEFEHDDEILDGVQLGQSLMVYSRGQCQEITRSGGLRLFATKLLPGYRGVWGADCAIEVQNSHYCFGPEDIVKHSGIAEPIPVAKGRVRKRIYESIAVQDAEQFFVFKLQSQKELWFCYRTADSRAKFFGSPLGCNMAAVLQWETGAWTFVDLPFVTSASGLIIQTGGTWEEDTGTWDDGGGTWNDDETLARRSVVLSSVAVQSNQIFKHRLLALDGLGESSGLDLPLCEEAFARAYARRFGLDLDVEGMELSEYKHLRFMYPQGDFPDGGLLFRAGGSLTPKGSTLLPQTLSLRVSGGYMVPLKTGGRYLGYELASGSPQEFSMTGFDLDVVGLGKH